MNRSAMIISIEADSGKMLSGVWTAGVVPLPVIVNTELHFP